MRRFSRGLTALLAAAGLSSAQASDDVFGYAVPSEDLPVAVKVDYVVTGCWVFTQSTFYLKVTRSGAEVSGRGDDWEDPVKLSPKKLSRAEGERILRDLTSAMLRRESESASGHAPTHYETTVEWACGGVRGAKRGTVAFMAPAYDLYFPDEGEGDTYARAVGIRDVVVKALRQAHR
ncbi:hypothetical protein [Myxococcus xanthus]|uniref:hypothetical protein n=1 Tax=Myxococcus xanthus TaxID=34 RepID=UPI00112D7048|nr:hypothetical protein [Myxococcus xanthus]QDF01652.1 hypothetical protein BHS04_00245 [Myxococcus xanthus]